MKKERMLITVSQEPDPASLLDLHRDPPAPQSHKTRKPKSQTKKKKRKEGKKKNKKDRS